MWPVRKHATYQIRSTVFLTCWIIVTENIKLDQNEFIDMGSLSRFWIQCFSSRVRKKSNILVSWLKHESTLNEIKRPELIALVYYRIIVKVSYHVIPAYLPKENPKDTAFTMT